jgi:hypothetical protein
MDAQYIGTENGMVRLNDAPVMIGDIVTDEQADVSALLSRIDFAPVDEE